MAEDPTHGAARPVPQPAQQGAPQGYPPAQAYPQPGYPQAGYPVQGYPQPAQPQVPQLPTYGAWEDANGAQAGGGLRRAFTGLAVGDVVRDALAVLLLLLGLLHPWDYAHDGVGRLEVVAVTVLSLASLATGYLARAGAFGAAFDARRAGRWRFALNVPFLLVVLGYVIGDAAVGDMYELLGGLGSGLALGLAGATLALAPRTAELGAGNSIDRAWLTGVAVLGAVAVVWVVAAALVLLLGDEADLIEGAQLAFAMLLMLTAPTVLVLGLVGVLRREEGWRLALVALAGSAVVVQLTTGGETVLGVATESVREISAGLVFWPALAAAAAAPSARRAMRVTDARWAAAAARVLTAALVVAGAWLVMTFLVLSDTEESGRWITLAALAVGYLAVAAWGRALVRAGQRVSTAAALSVAGALCVLGLGGYFVLLGSEWGLFFYVERLLGTAVPALFAGLVLAHKSQEARGVLRHPAVPERPTWSAPAGPAAVAPTGPVPAAAGPQAAPSPVDDAVRQALDPATPQATLAELATRFPATRVHIARHPAVYPELLAWLDSLGDPEVSRAVAERRGG